MGYAEMHKENTELHRGKIQNSVNLRGSQRISV